MEQLQAQIDELKKRLDDLHDYSTIPLEFENALLARGFLKVVGTGVLKGTGNVITTIAGISGTVYVAPTSGASPTTAITFTSGVRTT